MTTAIDQAPIGSVGLSTVIRAPARISPRIGLGGGRVDRERVAEFKRMLVEDLRALPEPICVENQGSMILADGYHRVAALSELAREFPGDRRFQFVSIRIVNAPSGQQPAAYAYEIALECSAKGPLPLTRAEKQAAIARLVLEHPEWSDREVARRVGVDHKTVGSVRRRGYSPAGERPLRAGNGEGRSASAARVARIASQVVRYGDELAAEGSGVDYDEIVAEFAYRFGELHPATAREWV